MLYLSMSAAWIMSANAVICWSPYMSLSSEKTRSAAAELGVNDPTGGAGDSCPLHDAPFEPHDVFSLAGPSVTPRKDKNRKNKWWEVQVLSSGSDTQVGEDSPEVKRERHLRPRSLI